MTSNLINHFESLTSSGQTALITELARERETSRRYLESVDGFTRANSPEQAYKAGAERDLVKLANHLADHS